MFIYGTLYMMDQNIVYGIFLGILGLVSGSFAGASVWRLRAAQLRADQKNKIDVTASEKKQVAKLKKKSLQSDRSVCLHCGHTLAWYDLIPLVSWLTLRGRCRYCHQRIGWFEPAMELGVAFVFVISYFFWPMSLTTVIDIARFVIWLVASVGLVILFAYDMKWYLLPNTIVFPLIGLGAVNAILVAAASRFDAMTVSSIVFSCAILSGLYYLIYIFSKRQWVGFGDVKLGLALALLLSSWQLALTTLFLANLIGTLIFLPFMLSGKMNRQTHVPFGPLLISGWFISGIFGMNIIHWYMGITLGL